MSVLSVTEQSVQTQFHDRKAELQTALAALLGDEDAWVIDLDATVAWSYASKNGAEAPSFGALLYSHLEAFVASLREYLQLYGEAGKSCFLRAVTARTVVFEVNPLGQSSDVISGSVSADGTYSMLFHPGWFGHPSCDPTMLQVVQTIYNAVDPVQFSLQVLDGLRLRARYAIDNLYDPVRVRAAQRRLEVALDMEGVVLDPNWFQVYGTLQPRNKLAVDSVVKSCVSYFERMSTDFEESSRIEFRDHAITAEIERRIPSKTFRIVIVPRTATIGAMALEDGVVMLKFGPRELGEWLPENAADQFLSLFS
uniref:Uncharacterized protein n=1 Tax=Mycena chlorophos TaxID=658473 RepID=A0ABQ0LCL4_MYCCL|nr:predicted protein [Mycena chlorophos]